jgi:hypothetical protein
LLKGLEHPITYTSKKLSDLELKYTTTEKECLAVRWAIEHFDHYLCYQPFEVMTDHSALNWLLTTKHVKGRVARLALFLQAYDFTIKHRPGNKNQNDDAFSRMIPINMALTEELEEESTTNSRWIHVHFSALNMPGCQTKWQWNGLMNNRQYRRNSYACNKTDHHLHWYCIYCYQCANPHGNYIPFPSEHTLCRCDDYYQDFSDFVNEYFCQNNEY